MIVTALNRRYAKSLLDLSIEQNKLEESMKDMDYVMKVIASSRDLRVLLKSPIVNADKKEAILVNLFQGQISDLTFKFINIILSKGRESQLEGIAHGFLNLYRKNKGIEEAVVTSAVELSEAQRNDIREKLKGITGNSIEITEMIDPSIIGGVKIRVGDKQYNGSIAYQLDQLKRQFESNQYIADF
ncbi:ATP synthase F1 subunit delta [Owenweeksia hongkongensis]|uniref:ATP synthase subunit delta n=1 Tax=Owenweeksia hongkongensis (strain DSM 17368 / CIP 108786 / JCM 12287 / NRRL B-23963 / UST20020801) TaxID=926562 RepID=G8R6C3_OWEHD|nr:ATP synthase F1 subunit delta [Owenweeksia hongkongensis]AEV33343.1 ATP synthase, F1 delta subunit [Owenweeksia hongkongensis DSM 17368]